MRITRTRLSFERHFVQIPNAWMRDHRISRKARGLLAEMMTHDAGWQMSVKSLSTKDKGPEGREAIQGAVKELEKAGYLIRTQNRTSGKFSGVDYELCDPFETRPDDPLPAPGPGPEIEPKETDHERVSRTPEPDPAPEKPRKHAEKPPQTGNPSTAGSPLTGFPLTDFPVTGNPSLKNKSFKEDHPEEEGGSPQVGTSPAAETREPERPYQDLGGGVGADRPEAPPRPDRCPFHQYVEFPPPCQGCKAAREELVQRDRQAFKERMVLERQEQAQAFTDRMAMIEQCPMCDEDGYVNGHLCDHDPERPERARRGAQMAREALRGVREG